ncbi:MAG: TIGR02147 family protein [Chitinispirillaceae bacterium]|nr:TIGR02147 family protein [Chitinispirillaceae bacterium]
MHATSAGWFSDVISGRINLTDTYIPRLVSVLKLSTAEAEFFRTLVHCNPTKNLEEQNRFLTMLIEHRSTGAVTVSKERFLYYSTWYIPVIRELLFFSCNVTDWPGYTVADSFLYRSGAAGYDRYHRHAGLDLLYALHGHCGPRFRPARRRHSDNLFGM